MSKSGKRGDMGVGNEGRVAGMQSEVVGWMKGERRFMRGWKRGIGWAGNGKRVEGTRNMNLGGEVDEE